MFAGVKAFWLKQGLKIMLAGFFLSAAGILFYIKTQHGDPDQRTISFGITVAGIAIYAIGRIGVLLERHRIRREHDTMQDGSEKEEES